MESNFHRSVDFCGTCHDVSNPGVGNLAHNFGAQAPFLATEQVIADGSITEDPKDYTNKAAFNNQPYRYGIVERTFSEYKAGLISQTLVSDYPDLPADLQGGALKADYTAALTAGTNGDYEDGTPRFFSCQTCHLRNALPVPDTQYNGGPGQTYDYFDTFALQPPLGAATATIDLLYQPTSYEYLLFLLKANRGANPFLAEEGANMFEAWLNTDMASPYLMASATWRDPGLPACTAGIPELAPAAPGDAQIDLT